MTVIRHLSVVTLAASLALFGCSKDEKKKAEPAGEKASKVAAESGDSAEPGAARKKPAPTDPGEKDGPTDAKMAVDTTPPPPVKGPGAAEAGFEMFRADMDLVVGMNFNSLRANVAYAMAKPMVMGMLNKESGGKYAAFTGACGFDPIESIHSFTMGGVINGDDDFLFVVAGVDRNRLVKCMEGIAKLANDELKIANEGKLTTFTGNNDEPMHIAWHSDSTLLFAPKAKKDALLERAAGKKGMSGNASMTELLGRVNNKATVWAVSTPPADKQKDMEIKFTGLHASLDLNDGLVAKLALMTTDEAEAQKGADKLKTELQKQLGEMEGSPMSAMAKQYAEKVKIVTDGKYVIVELSLSDEEYQQVLAMAKGFAQMAGGL